MKINKNKYNRIEYIELEKSSKTFVCRFFKTCISIYGRGSKGNGCRKRKPFKGTDVFDFKGYQKRIKFCGDKNT